MNVKACAPADKATSWETIDWIAAKGYVRKLQMRIVKAVKQGQSFRLTAGFLIEALKGLSRVKGNFHARFLGEGWAVMSVSYPTEGIK